MGHKVLALKFRPQIFEDIVGQEHITLTLINSIKNRRIAHAYLFSGPRGVGKTTTARVLAKALNCEKGISHQPCNNCANCIQIINSNSLDVEEIDGASNRGINEIRELKEKTKTYPLNSRYKIFIIDEVHMLTNEAFNALLKVLEEPPKHVVFIFATTESHKIPITILSRCQRFDFKRISTNDILKKFKEILNKENIEIDNNTLLKVAKKSDGSMRDGLSLLEQIINFYFDENSENYIDEILGYIDTSIYNQILSAIIVNDHKKIIDIIKKLYYEGIDFIDFYKNFIEYLENLISISIYGNKIKIEDTPENISEMKNIVSRISSSALNKMLDIFLKEYSNLKFSDFPHLNLELLFFKSFSLINETEKKEKKLIASENVIKNKNENYDKSKSIAKKWSSFLDFLSTKKPLLYGAISQIEPNFKGAKIILNIDKDLNIDSLELEKLKKDFSAFTNGEIDLEIKVTNNIDKNKSFKQEVLQNRVVNDIITLFNGKIEEIKKY